MRTGKIICWLAALLIVLLLIALAGPQLLQWSARLRFPWERRFPAGIVIHHTATPPRMSGGAVVDAAAIDGMHQHFTPVTGRDGKVYHIAYHFVILPDGAVQQGRPEYLPGAHTLGHANTLGIVLVGNFERASNRGRQGPLTPPPAQLAAAERLTKELMARYRLPLSRVYLHRDLRPTACPGDGFPRTQFYRAITR